MDASALLVLNVEIRRRKGLRYIRDIANLDIYPYILYGVFGMTTAANPERDAHPNRDERRHWSTCARPPEEDMCGPVRRSIFTSISMDIDGDSVIRPDWLYMTPRSVRIAGGKEAC